MTLLDIPATDHRPEPERDRYGRYLIPWPTEHTDLPSPTKADKMPWTRATTWAGTCDDTFGLTKWELRMAAVGLARRPDLLAQVATVTDPDDRDAKKLLDSITNDAKEAAGSTIRRNLGVALHSFTEAIDRGEDHGAPDAHHADLDAYRTALSDAGIIIDRAHIERIVTVPSLVVAGTFDRLVTHNGRLLVADLKTGRDVKMGMGKIAVQLALYANATTIYDAATGTHEAMPEVDKTTALVFHLPVGEARCDIYEVDIAAGWEMAHTCGTVRTWRKRKDLSRLIGAPAARLTTDKPVTVEPSTVPVPTTRDEWIAGRIEVLKVSTAARQLMAASWPAGCPKRAPWTDAQIDAIDPVLVAVETAVEAPFPHPDPTVPTASDDLAVKAQRAQEDRDLAAALTAPAPSRPVPDDGPVTDRDVDALKAEAHAVPHLAKVCGEWRSDAKRSGHPWGGAVDGAWTQRCYADNAAALACARHLLDGDDDSLVRAALAYVLGLGTPLTTNWRIGPTIGAMTTDEVLALRQTAELVARGNTEVIEALGSLLA